MSTNFLSFILGMLVATLVVFVAIQLTLDPFLEEAVDISVELETELAELAMQNQLNSDNLDDCLQESQRRFQRIQESYEVARGLQSELSACEQERWKEGDSQDDLVRGLYWSYGQCQEQLEKFPMREVEDVP